MAMTVVEDPLTSPSPIEIPLENAPLVRVIAQVRFPTVLTIEQRDFVAPFQEGIRSTYPVLRQEQAQGVVVTPAGVTPVKPQTAWRFSDVAEHWRVSLTPEFLALETTKYTSRADFLERLRTVVAVLDEHVEPKLIDRVGIRYIDRISGVAVDDIVNLVRAEMRGITGTSVAARALHALTETMFELDHAHMVARWGLLPPGVTIDPTAIEPAPEKSWILDLDMFSASPVPFGVDRVVDDARRFAERIYTFFRWAVTDDFLRRYGGKP